MSTQATQLNYSRAVVLTSFLNLTNKQTNRDCYFQGRIQRGARGAYPPELRAITLLKSETEE